MGNNVCKGDGRIDSGEMKVNTSGKKRDTPDPKFA